MIEKLQHKKEHLQRFSMIFLFERMSIILNYNYFYINSCRYTSNNWICKPCLGVFGGYLLSYLKYFHIIYWNFLWRTSLDFSMTWNKHRKKASTFFRYRKKRTAAILILILFLKMFGNFGNGKLELEIFQMFYVQ